MGVLWRALVFFSPTAEWYGVFAQCRFRCVLGDLARFREARFREGTGFREPVPGPVSGTGSGKPFRVQKVASPRFRRFRCSMGSKGLGSVPEVWTARFWEPGSGNPTY